MAEKIKERCIFCGGDVYYRSGEQLVKCSLCGHTLKTAKFENELARIRKTEEENALVKEKLAEAEKEKQAADDRLFAALSNLDSMENTQGEVLELIQALKTESAQSSSVLSDTLRILMSGQKDASHQLQFLKDLSERLLRSQDDLLMRAQTQNDIIMQLYSIEMDAQKRQELAGRFMLWMQNVRKEDAEKLQQIGETSGRLLAGQKRIEDSIEKLRKEASDIHKSLKSFEGKWESASLQELQKLYHQAADFQHDRIFDKAAEYYHKVLTKGGEDAEVYWRLIMCHYCLTYQRDDEGRLIPIILNPDLTDPGEMSLRKNLQQLLTEQERTYYQAELAKIDRILDKYRELKDQVQYDVFISVKQNRDGHYTVDSDMAADLYDFLTDQGMRVFNSRRTIIPAGQEYEPYIISALMSAKAMIVVGTTPANMNAQWVKNEWSRFQWLQRHEKAKTGKTERVLICYLSKGMQPGQIPKALNPDRQAVFDGVKAHDELLTSLAFLRTDAGQEKIPAAEDSRKIYQRIKNQMTFWLVMGEYDKVREKYKQLSDQGLFLTHASLHLAALCAKRKVSDIRQIVQSEIVLNQEKEYVAAVLLCKNAEERAYLKDLKEQNQNWRSKAVSQEPERTEPQAEQIPERTEPQEQKIPEEVPVKQEVVPRELILRLINVLNHVKNQKEQAEEQSLRLTAILGYVKGQKELEQGGKTAQDWWYQGKEAEDKNDFLEAVHCYQEAALRGHGLAQYRLGLCYEKAKGTLADPAEAVKWYIKAANQEIPEAQEAVGRCLSEGIGVPKNEKEAINWYYKAAEKGNDNAQYQLGVCCYLGKGVPKDTEEALRWFRKAAAQGHKGGANWLQQVWKEQDKENAESWYQTGLSYAKISNFIEAAGWYKKAADAGHAEAQYELAGCYQYGKGVKQSNYSAAAWYKRAAVNGNRNAQYIYGRFQKYGLLGIAKNYKEAAAWFRKAALQGHAEAQVELGHCYVSGSGIKMNLINASKWYKTAADLGSPSGMYHYAVCLKEGRGTTQNLAEAAAWFRKSADQGNALAQNQLGICYETGAGIGKSHSMAAYWYKKAAEQGESWGQYNYAVCLKEGRGVTKNPAEAAALFRESAEQGNSWAQNQLGICYETGAGLEKDLGMAVFWYKKSAELGYPWGQYNYALRLYWGGGAVKNAAEAANWFRKAADAGIAEAQYMMGVCCQGGFGGPASKEEAIKWFQKAADQGHEQARKSLEKLTKKKKWFF